MRLIIRLQKINALHQDILIFGNLTSQFFAKGLPAKTMILFFGKKLWARDSSGAERSKGWRAFAGRPLECNHG